MEEKRHGGKAEGGKHAKVGDDDGELDGQENDGLADTMAVNKSKWGRIPSCPADMDLKTVGQKRWKMDLKEFVTGVENGTVQIEEVAFREAH